MGGIGDPSQSRFRWNIDHDVIRRWQQGETGIPFVDAAMRELKETGYMSNRSRIIAANYFTTELRMDWRLGAAHYETCLLDYSVASNWVNWLIAANLMNEKHLYLHPVNQARQLDPDGSYIRRWVPELSSFPIRWIHRPWEAPKSSVDGCGIRLGESYPLPLGRSFGNDRVIQRHFGRGP